jgi:cytochrome c oxidase cbb3-type subunit 3/ubiquinol-cytochrome c reductase cytochrome c subunit
MKNRPLATAVLVTAFALAGAGCGPAPGKPGAEPEKETIRPDQVSDFSTLYSQNCAACHGDHGRDGAAISLANPVYLAYAGRQNLQRVTTSGVAGTMMPGFGKSAGGMLTDRQIAIISQGMISAWGNPASFQGQALPVYASNTTPDIQRGQAAFGAYCASCHGADATEITAKDHPGTQRLGSLVDPAYLSLISDQGLRSILVAGKPEQGMPDYRSHQGHTLTDQEITDIVAWLTSHRIATPGQVYPQPALGDKHD